jgi:hypothetical protein
MVWNRMWYTKDCHTLERSAESRMKIDGVLLGSSISALIFAD